MTHDFRLNVETRTLTASGAIVLYSNNGSVRYALMHDLLPSGELGTGRPLTVPDLSNALQGMLAMQNKDAGFLPGHVLMSHAGKLVWWKKPCRKTLSVKVGGTFFNFEAELPGLVFSVTAGHLRVAAVKGSERPEPDTPCFKPPFFNFYDDGSMCQGNVDYPDGAVLSRIEAWESAVFDSNFTHPNSQAMVDYPGGLSKLWRELKDGVIAAIPESALVPMKTSTVLEFCGAKS